MQEGVQPVGDVKTSVGFANVTGFKHQHALSSQFAAEHYAVVAAVGKDHLRIVTAVNVDCAAGGACAVGTMIDARGFGNHGHLADAHVLPHVHYHFRVLNQE